jgi:hypothetical protein
MRHLVELLPLLGTGAWLFWRYILLPMLSQIVGGWIKQRVVRSVHEGLAWEHYKLRKLHRGHQARSVHDCQQDECSRVIVG